MLTIGVDLAAANERTALASIEWSPGRAVVRELRVGVDDQAIVDAIGGAAKTGLDCPLGWPAPFVDLISAHHPGHIADLPIAGHERDWRRRLTLRTTDLVVWEETGKMPLSVAADRIAHAALRCAGVLAMATRRGYDVDRCGDGAIVEVYPAASVRRWGLRPAGAAVKGHDAMLDALGAAAPWLDPGEYQGLCRRSRDAFDAVVAAMSARAAAVGSATRPDAAQRAVAAIEGWIAVPTGQIGDLVR